MKSAGTAAGAQPPGTVPLETLLARAAHYIDTFVGKFVDVVAEEQYVQNATYPLPSFNPLSGRGAPNASSVVQVRHRELTSDFLLVRSPESADLLAFRDVLEVDGTPVRDHQQRIEWADKSISVHIKD